jgi:CheY-like chemotaxis protein
VPNILIVDDEPLQRILMRETLAEDPLLSFVEAATGAEALAQIRVESPDLILLDVMMPDMSGFEVCRKIKGDPALRAIPVILVTRKIASAVGLWAQTITLPNLSTRPTCWRKCSRPYAPETKRP